MPSRSRRWRSPAAAPTWPPLASLSPSGSAGCHSSPGATPGSGYFSQQFAPFKTAPNPEGVVRCVQSALADAQTDASEIDLIKTWVDQGAARGDAADEPAPPEFTTGWQLGEPDLVVTAPSVRYRYFAVQ